MPRYGHLDACTGKCPHAAYWIASVQKRLGSGVWMGGGQCRCCGSFLDPQLGRSGACGTAEATRGHCACVHAVVCGMKLADPGITTEPRGLTASQSRPSDIFTTAAFPGRSAAVDVCVASFPIANCLTAGMKSQTCGTRATHCRPLVWTADGRPRRHSNTAVCRHRIQPQRAANVGEIASTQMEGNMKYR